MKTILLYGWLSPHHFEEKYPRFLGGRVREIEGHFSPGKKRSEASAITIELQVSDISK